MNISVKRYCRGFRGGFVQNEEPARIHGVPGNPDQPDISLFTRED